MTESKLIAIGVDKKGQVWSGHFGITPQYNLYDHSGNLIEERQNPYGAGSGGKHTHHDTPKLIVDLLPECSVFIARRMGEGSKQKLARNLGVEIVITKEKDAQIALKAYLSGASNNKENKTMSFAWIDKKDEFETVDVRQLRGNFLPMVQKKAVELTVGQGLRVIQSFEPLPLYTVLDDMGFEHETVKVSDEEYHAYFYKVAAAPSGEKPKTPPLQPLGMLKFKQVDPLIADQFVKVWERIYQREDAAIDQKNLYLIAFGVGIGAGRMRQATRELVKAYAAGATAEELDEVFALLIWLEGASTFVSEISTSAAFGAYELIKKMEKQGTERGMILSALMEKFGERNPDVGIFA